MSGFRSFISGIVRRLVFGNFSSSNQYFFLTINVSPMFKMGLLENSQVPLLYEDSVM